MIKRIFIVPYCHCDWAWTHTRLWHERRYDLVFNEVLDLLKKHPEFRWYMDNYLCQLTPFLKRSPHRLEELRQRIGEGKIAVCGAFANIRPNMTNEETFIRNLVIGKKKFRELFPGADLSLHGDIVDVAVGHPQMPQVLSLAGYRYFIFWRPEVALNHKKIPYEFIWEGLDGSEVIAHRACYGGLCFKGYVPNDFRERWDEVKKIWEETIEYRSRFSPTGLVWISHGNDDARPLRTLYTDEPLDLLSFREEWNKREEIEIQFATPLEFFRELEKYVLPRVKGTLDPCDVCYNAAFGGSQGLWKLRIDADRALTEAEKWSSLNSIWGGEYPQEFPTLWENLLNFSAHATQWLFQEDFDALYKLALQTLWQGEDIKTKAQREIASRIQGEAKDESIVAFNPLPYEREEWIKVLLSFPTKMPKRLSLLDGGGREVPFQVLKEVGLEGWEVEVLAKVPLPPLGFNVLRVREEGTPPTAQAQEKDILENSSLQLTFRGGELTKIEEKGTGRIYQSQEGFGSLRLCRVDVRAELHMGEVLEELKPKWERWEIIEGGSLRQSLLREGRIGSHPVRQRVRLYEGEARIEFATEVEWQGEDGFLAFLLPLPFPARLWGDFPFGVEEKDLEKELYGPGEGDGGNIERWRKGNFYAKSFLDWSDGEKGIAYINHDGDRYYIFHFNENSLYHILINSILTCEGWEKDINIQRKGIGYHRFTGSLLLHPGDWREAKVYRRAMELRNPPSLLYRDREWEKGKGNLPPWHSFLSLQPENLILTAFYKEGDSYFLRFYETEGKETLCSIKLPFRPSFVEAVNFLGEEIKESKVDVRGEEVSLLVKPWKIITLRIRR